MDNMHETESHKKEEAVESESNKMEAGKCIPELACATNATDYSYVKYEKDGSYD